jgi:hypothetical protein
MSFFKEAIKSVITLGASSRVKWKKKKYDKIYNKYNDNRLRMNGLSDYAQYNVDNLIRTKKNAIIALRRMKAIFEYLSVSDYKELKEPKNSLIKTSNINYIEDEFRRGDIAVSGTIGATTGIASSFGAYALVSTFGFASTGTFIGSLSGAALHNATMAALGGGSLAAGGGGMAAGAVTLGWFFTIPAIAITGIQFHSRASTKIEKMDDKIRQMNQELPKIKENLSILDNITVDIFHMHIDEYTTRLQELTCEFKKLYEIEYKNVFKYPFFSKLYRYIRKYIFRKNFYSESDLVSVSKVSEKAEAIISMLNQQLNTNSDERIDKESDRNEKYKLTYDEVKSLLIDDKDFKDYIISNYHRLDQTLGDKKYISLNNIYEVIMTFFISKSLQENNYINESESLFIDRNNNWKKLSPLDFTKKINSFIDENKIINPIEYSQLYWLLKENKKWILENNIFLLDLEDLSNNSNSLTVYQE